jgi:hypothetical protein
MTIALTGAGGLFTVAGHMWGGMADVLAIQGAAATPRVLAAASMKTRWNTLDADFAASPQKSSTFDGFYNALTAYQGAQAGVMNQLVGLATNLFIRMADDDIGLKSKTFSVALTEVIRQMVANAQTVNATTVVLGPVTPLGTPVGTPVIVVSVVDGTGAVLQYLFQDVLRFVCTSDSQTGNATPGQETVTVSTQAAVTPSIAYNWPSGSGVSVALPCVDGSQSNAAGNLLMNSGFETFTTTNYPDNWVTLVGTPGTQILNGGPANVYSGAGSLQLQGDAGGSLTALTQEFNHLVSTSAGAGGTPAKVTPQTPYALNGWIKCSATPTAGVLEFSLTDGNNVTLADASGTNNLFTRSLTTVSTTWLPVSGVFRLPAVLPPIVRLKARLSTAIDSGKSVYLDRLSFTKMAQLYTGGPFAAVFSGSTNLLSSDSWTVAVTPTWGAIQLMMERGFGMRTLALTLPNSTTPTIPDSLIT